jgi:excisionase family DNA binding protein
MPDKLTVGEVARRLGVSPATVKRWAAAGVLPGEKLGRAWVFDESRLQDRAAYEDAGGVEVDFDSSLTHLQSVDLVRELWVPDVLWFRDYLADRSGLFERTERKLTGRMAFDPALEVEIPKGPFYFSRQALLLSIEDRLAYQAAVEAISERVEEQRPPNVYSATLATQGSKYFLKKGVDRWLEWRAAVARAVTESPNCMVVSADVTAYFDHIQHGILFQELESLGSPSWVVRALRNMLRAWSVAPGVGIPQGPDASRLLGNLYLFPVDDTMSHRGWQYFRYMDDVRIVAPDRAGAAEAVRVLDRECRRRGLTLASHKTKLLSAAVFLDDMASGDFADVQYFMEVRSSDEARRLLRQMLDEATRNDDGAIDARTARFSLTRLRTLFDPADRRTVELVLGRLEDLGPVVRIAMQFLWPHLIRKEVRDGLASFLEDDSRNFSPYVASWVVALALDAPELGPEGWRMYARRVSRDRNEPEYLRILTANLLSRYRRASDIQWLEKEIKSEHNPALVRGYLVALARVGRLTRSTAGLATSRFTGLGATVDFVQGRTTLPSLIYADRGSPRLPMMPA